MKLWNLDVWKYPIIILYKSWIKTSDNFQQFSSFVYSLFMPKKEDTTTTTRFFRFRFIIMIIIIIFIITLYLWRIHEWKMYVLCSCKFCVCKSFLIIFCYYVFFSFSGPPLVQNYILSWNKHFSVIRTIMYSSLL